MVIRVRTKKATQGVWVLVDFGEGPGKLPSQCRFSWCMINTNKVSTHLWAQCNLQKFDLVTSWFPFSFYHLWLDNVVLGSLLLTTFLVFLCLLFHFHNALWKKFILQNSFSPSWLYHNFCTSLKTKTILIFCCKGLWTVLWQLHYTCVFTMKYKTNYGFSTIGYLYAPVWYKKTDVVGTFLNATQWDSVISGITVQSTASSLM